MSINVELTRVVAVTLTANGNAAAGEHTPVDATSGAVTVTLPAASASNVGAKLSIEKIDTSANAVTVSGSIRGATGTLTLGAQSETVELLADTAGSWWPVAGTHGQSGTYAKVRTVRAALVLHSPYNTAAAPGSPLDVGFRTLVRLPFGTTRWRVKWANRNVLANTAPTTPITSGGFYLGAPAYDATSGAWINGVTSAAPTQVIPGSIALPTDGSDWVSAWVTDPAQQLGDFDQVLTWNAALAASGTGYGNEFVSSVFYSSSGGAAAAASAAPTGFASAAGFGDLRIEYEALVPVTVRVGLFVGDSVCAGLSDGDVTKTRQGTYPHEAWPGAAGARAGLAVVNAGIGSATTATFKASSGYQWSRFDLATTVPDFAVVALGTNDLTSAEADIPGIVANLRALGIKTVYAATVTPRNYAQGYLTASVSSGATSISSSVNTGTVSILLGSGRTQEQVTVSAVSGTGPYTLTVPALANAHTGGTGLGPGGAEQIVYTANEISRQQLNDYLRQLPGITGVLDFDAAVAAFTGSASLDLRMASSDNLHLLRAGYQRLAEVAAACLTRP